MSGFQRGRNRLVAALLVKILRSDSLPVMDSTCISYRAFIGLALRGLMFHSTLTALTNEVIRLGDVVVDGGSKMGFFVLLAATTSEGNNRVFVFGGEPNICALLQRII